MLQRALLFSPLVKLPTLIDSHITTISSLQVQFMLINFNHMLPLTHGYHKGLHLSFCLAAEILVKHEGTSQNSFNKSVESDFVQA